jgi:hypothetical protein
MTRYRRHLGRLPVIAGLSTAALAGAALAVPGAPPPTPHPQPQPLVRITCPAATLGPARAGSTPEHAQCAWQYRMGVRRPLWP